MASFEKFSEHKLSSYHSSTNFGNYFVKLESILLQSTQYRSQIQIWKSKIAEDATRKSWEGMGEFPHWSMCCWGGWLLSKIQSPPLWRRHHDHIYSPGRRTWWSSPLTKMAPRLEECDSASLLSTQTLTLTAELLSYVTSLVTLILCIKLSSYLIMLPLSLIHSRLHCSYSSCS